MTQTKHFSMHTAYIPRVYRSPSGCCICKAKSSSSRFTSSKKYEPEFYGCFLLTGQRSGEICNACVLLVKRYRKLPPGTDKNWASRVDRGTGTKYTGKNRKKRNKMSVVADVAKSTSSESTNKKHRYVRKASREPSPAVPGLGGEERYNSEGGSRSNSASPCHFEEDLRSDRSLLLAATSRRRQKQGNPSQYKGYSEGIDFIDFSYWKLERVCCGVIYRGQLGEVLIDRRFFKPCCKGPKPDPSGGVKSKTTCDLQEEDEGVLSLEDEVVLKGFHSSNKQNIRLLNHFEAAFVN